MIGVAVPSTEREIAAEFFELFKTPWEFCRADGNYDAVICTEEPPPVEAKLVLVYQPVPLPFDRTNQIALQVGEAGAVAFGNQILPLYGAAAVFPASEFRLLKWEPTQQPLGWCGRLGKRMVLRIGYNLFAEARFLLNRGQPSANACLATLEWHIEILRELLLRFGQSFVEIPPVPDGYAFTVCLTHDLDHPVLRNHFCDHTMCGFLYRASLGAFLEACRGRKSWRGAWENWRAAASLPLVFGGLAEDPWRRFEKYVQIEEGMGATYFVIPRKGYSGKRTNGHSPSKRAARYSIKEIQPELEKIARAGHEIALHGLDAWLDAAGGREEQEELARTLGKTAGGVRMHWLFFDEGSPQVLEQGGFSYDSSFGFNETVGYRAGTAQVYKFCGTANLLELPLIVMDTALFYPAYLNLDEKAAEHMVDQLADQVARFGGVLTINWHDRSIAPERQWGGVYCKLLRKLQEKGAWFPTATQAVKWFRKRRMAVFSTPMDGKHDIKFNETWHSGDGLPGLRLRWHRPKARDGLAASPADSTARCMNLRCDESIEPRLAISA